MQPDALLAALRAALDSARAEPVRALASANHPADLAAALQELEAGEVCALLRDLPAESQADLFGYLPTELQVEVAARFSRSELADLFVRMSPDDRTDLFNRLPEDSRESFLPALAQVEREDLRRLSVYPEGTVGAIMTSDYAALPPELTAREAVEHLRAVAPDKETIYQAYVVDGERRLVGTVSLRDLIIAAPHQRIQDFMKHEVIAVPADAAREEAARQVSKYDLIALPVVDGEGRLVGIVTYDDAMDVAEEEATADFRKVGAVGELAASVREATIGALYRKRVSWLVILVFANLLTGAGIAFYEETIAAYVSLVVFLPLLIGSGGNAGSQSATLMVRALATGDVMLRDWATMLGRELLVAALLGATMAIAVSLLGFWRGGPAIAQVVVLTMFLVVIAGSLIGMSLPFLLHRFRLDPATASAPLITTIADVTGVVLYFAIATTLLGLPPA